MFAFIVLCVSNGQVYKEGEMIKPNHTTRCTCQEGGFDCITEETPLNGSTCVVYGDPHYKTFDHRHYSFQGTCEYVLSQPCNSDDFIIVGQNVHVNCNPFASETESVRIIVKNGPEIHLTRRGGGQVTINGDLKPNNGDGLIDDSFDGVEVFRIGRHPFVLLTLEGSFPIGVHWDGRRRVRITASSLWQGMLCGQCGNYNEQRNDDYQLRDGSLTISENIFGNDWEYAKTTADCGIPGLPPSCPADIFEAAGERCRVLTSSTFHACNDVLDPTPFVEACVFDYCNCANETREGCFCGAIQSYATSCALEGQVIPIDPINKICRKFGML